MTGNVVVRTIERPAPDVVAALGEAGVATVHEAAGQTGLLGADLRPIHDGSRIAGPAVTVSCAPGDNIMIHAAMEVIAEGDVLVVATTSPSTHGMFGELLATSAMRRGCRGLIIDAGVRDVADLRQMGFPVWSKAINALGTTKAAPGSVNMPVVCAGGAVSPGDVVIGDDDGVMVVPRQSAADVLEATRHRLQREDEVRARLRSGELGLDIYGFRARLEDMDVSWVDTRGE
jgi:4-hydroxy-4-methyl-2-oxoglutarate aldolase